jgi:hypothetical protein
MKKRSKQRRALTFAVENKTTYYRSLALILLLTGLIRLYGVTNPLYDMNYWRQTETAALALNYFEDHLPFLYPEVDWIGPHGHAEMEFPLYPYFLSLVYRLFGPSDLFGRLLTILCSIGVAWAVWEIGRRLFEPRIGLLAAAFFAASPLAVYFGRTYQPDMMMVFFSTFSIALLLRWKHGFTLGWFYASALALAVGVLLKPPCLLVAFPLCWILFKQKRMAFLCSIHTWIFAAIVMIPAFLWYSHARTFFEESNASFMWHFENFSVKNHLLAVYLDLQFWRTLVFRFSDEIFCYIGLIPFAFGLLRCCFPHPARSMVWLWLLGISGLYLAIPGHHIGHSYYSLLAIPPSALVAAVGCYELWFVLNRRIHLPFLIAFIFPLSVAILGFPLLVSRGSYDKIYFFYDDAVALQKTVPKSALIAVMDDLLHTPEFFYFINRNGWHRSVYPVAGSDESAWVEEVRAKGATYYFGLNEFRGNHPILYLQTHTHGQYLRNHYKIQDIGAHYFLARLDQPIYGNHLFADYADKTVAMASTSAEIVSPFLRQTVPLYDWRKADAILLDFHTIHPDEMGMAKTTYDAAIENGFTITHQESGRLLLEKNNRFEPIPQFLSTIDSTRLTPSKPLDKGRFYLGYFEAGRYRVSFQLPRSSYSVPLELKLENYWGIPFASRRLTSVHFSHLDEGERPECFFHLQQPQALYAVVGSEKGPIHPDSIVRMPDVQCMNQDAVIQAEQLMTYRTETIPDANADRESALWAWTEEDMRFICNGLYLQFPPGLYDVTFRLRAPNKWNAGNLAIGVYDQNDAVLARRELYPYSPGDSSLGQEYADVSLAATFLTDTLIDIRVFLFKQAEVVLDTIRLSQKKRIFDWTNLDEPLCLLPRDDAPAAITKSGRILDEFGNTHRRLHLYSSPIAWAAWNEKTGELYIDEDGRMIGANSEEYWSIARNPDEKIIQLAVSPDAASIGILTDQRRLFIWHEGNIVIHTAPQTDFPLRDLLVWNHQDALVLDGNGSILPIGDAESAEGIPVFWADVARALIHHPNGYYVVDCSGGIHNANGAPPVRSPFYKEEDWVLDAGYTPDGKWIFLTRDEGIRVFSE